MGHTTTSPSRQLDRSAVTSLLPVLILIPFWLLALAAFWVPVNLLTGVSYWWFPIGWLAMGALLLAPQAQVAMLSPTLSTRQPNQTELAIIEPIWRDLAQVANLPQNRYSIRVTDSDEINAYACGGHLVIVTTFAIEHLSTQELAGTLAHELSHHLGLHTVALTIGHWLTLPVVLLARFGFFLQNVARAATGSFASHSAALTAIGQLIAMMLTAVSWVFLAALYASDALSNLVAHKAEYDADQRAVRMGYGRPLVGALRVVIRLGGGHRPIGWRARLASSHPPARTRVARIEAMLRHPSR